MIVDIKNFPFYEYLKDDEKELFNKSISVKMIQKGMKIKCSNNTFGPFFIVEGRVRVYLHNTKEREIFLYSLNAGDLCVLTESRTLGAILFEAELKAETNMLVYNLESNAFKKIINNNFKVRSLIYEMMVERLSIFVENIQSVLFDSIESRIARFFIEEKNRLGSTVLNITQDEVAKNISSSKEVVSRALIKMAKKGIISYKKGIITLIDIDFLSKY